MKQIIRAVPQGHAIELDTVGEVIEKTISVKFTMYTNECNGKWCWIIVDPNGEERLLSTYHFNSSKEAAAAGARALDGYGEWLNGHELIIEEDEDESACNDTGKVSGQGGEAADSTGNA